MKINNTMKARVVVDIVYAMNFLHKHNIMNCDLKREKILLNSKCEETEPKDHPSFEEILIEMRKKLLLTCI